MSAPSFPGHFTDQIEYLLERTKCTEIHIKGNSNYLSNPFTTPYHLSPSFQSCFTLIFRAVNAFLHILRAYACCAFVFRSPLDIVEPDMIQRIAVGESTCIGCEFRLVQFRNRAVIRSRSLRVLSREC